MIEPNMNNPYEMIGGASTIRRLVEAFYPRVFSHPELISLFIGDIEEIMRKQEKFLTQFLGGPLLYSESYGPPNMMNIHAPFEITPTRAKAWLGCMRDAMDEIGLNGPVREIFFHKLNQVANIMINHP